MSRWLTRQRPAPSWKNRPKRPNRDGPAGLVVRNKLRQLLGEGESPVRHRQSVSHWSKKLRGERGVDPKIDDLDLFHLKSRPGNKVCNYSRNLHNQFKAKDPPKSVRHGKAEWKCCANPRQTERRRWSTLSHHWHRRRSTFRGKLVPSHWKRCRERTHRPGPPCPSQVRKLTFHGKLASKC